MTTYVKGIVFAVIPDYDQLHVMDAAGSTYAAVRKFIPGLEFEDYTEGQEVEVTVEPIGQISSKVVAIRALRSKEDVETVTLMGTVTTTEPDVLVYVDGEDGKRYVGIVGFVPGLQLDSFTSGQRIRLTIKPRGGHPLVIGMESE